MRGVAIHRPDSQTEIRKLADRALRRAAAIGKLPTPIDDLIAAANLRNEDSDDAKVRFAARLSNEARSIFTGLWQKIRGIADLRNRVVYIPRDTTLARERFAKAHELGHQEMPWQQFDPGYFDDDFSLRHDAREIFDREANFFAAEVIFQGEGFRTKARSYTPRLDAAFALADEHGASKHATLWRFVEDQDEAIAYLPYWPINRLLDARGKPVLRLGNPVVSTKFREKFGNLSLPPRLETDHPWTSAREDDVMREGEIRFENVDFEWQAWWNSYTLFVLLRRKPIISLHRWLN
jgi:Zn-dependent peptidase ImmA (M78 family)